MTYTFKNKKSSKIITIDLKISEYDQYKKDHPELERYHDSVPTLSFNGKTFGGLDSQTDNTFKEVLAKIGEGHPNSPLGDNYRKNKTIKETKTKEIFYKHVNKIKKEGKLK